MLAHILATAGVPHAAGANLGPPALSLGLLPDDGVYVLEMSSYMLERIATLRFDAASMLNLSPDHLDRHGDMAGYAHAKRQIFARQTEADTAIIGIDDAQSSFLADQFPRCLRISGFQPADIWCDGTLLRDAQGPIIDLRRAAALPGTHNAQNAAAAAALALALGQTRENIEAGIASFPGLAHRQEFIARIGGVRFINDSKATNADAVARALSCYDPIVWIAGGIAKSGGIDSLAAFFPRITKAFLIGRDAAAFAETLSAHHVAHEIVHTLQNAVPAAYEAARAAAPVSFSSPPPARASTSFPFRRARHRLCAPCRALEAAL